MRSQAQQHGLAAGCPCHWKKRCKMDLASQSFKAGHLQFVDFAWLPSLRRQQHQA